MILRGAAIHRDGHGKCGLLPPLFHHGLTPYNRFSVGSTVASTAVDPGVAMRHTAESHRLATRLLEERTRMCVMRESALCHGWTGE